MKPLNFKKIEEDIAAKLKPDVTMDDVFSHIMYPEVFAGYARFTRENGDLSPLPTPAFFYGMKPGQEISVEIEAGKTLFIRLVNIGAVDAEGKRAVNFELNGMARQLADCGSRGQAHREGRASRPTRPSPSEIGAPIPGLVTALAVSVGAKVEKGGKLLTLEAMKMQTTIYAPLRRRGGRDFRAKRRRGGKQGPAAAHPSGLNPKKKRGQPIELRILA